MTTLLPPFDMNYSYKKEDLKEKLLTIPPYTDEYTRLINEINKNLENEYKGQYILAFPRHFLDNPKYDICKRAGNLVRLYDSYTNLINNLLQLDNVLQPNAETKFMHRPEIEHDIRYKQIMVFGYIRLPNDNYIFLYDRKDDRIEFIGGHVEFDMNIYKMSTLEFIDYNFIREMLEEVDISYTHKPSRSSGKIRFHMDTRQDILNHFDVSRNWFLNFNEVVYDLKKCGFIYELKLNKENKDKLLMFEVKQEPDRYAIVKGTIKEIRKQGPPLHPWVDAILSVLENQKG